MNLPPFKHVYLSGPMTGVPGYNKDLFESVAARLRESGVEVTNPIESFDGDLSLPRHHYILQDILSLTYGTIDTVVVLPDWETSPGARLEVAVAYNIGLAIGRWADIPGLGTVVLEVPDKELRSQLAGFVPPGSPTEPAKETDDRDTLLSEEPSEVEPPPHTGDMFTCPHASTGNGDYIVPICEQCVDGGKLEDFEASITTPDPFNDDFSEGPDAEDMSYIPPQEPLEPHTHEVGSRITDEAWDLVFGDRQSAYNHPASDFEATGRMWGAILTNWFRSEGFGYGDRVPDIDPRIVALMIAMVKVSREAHKHKHDNLVDLIGYAVCGDRIVRRY